MLFSLFRDATLPCLAPSSWVEHIRTFRAKLFKNFKKFRQKKATTRKNTDTEDMGWGDFLKLVAKFFSFLSWPSFTMLCPLYVSVRAIESGSPSKNQQCLSYWVLFSLMNILEWFLAKLLEWLPFWSYAKGMSTVLLVIPYFGGAFYVYKHFIRPYISESSHILNSAETKQSNFLDVTERNIIKNKPEGKEEELFQCQETLESSYGSTEINVTRPTSPKKVQKEWSCALCLVSTTSEKCLETHLQGKKHKAKKEELRVEKLIKSASKSSSVTKRSNGMDFVQNINQIAIVNLEKLSGLLSPVAGSIRWCRWKRPGLGWTKLNTDGSVDPENAGFGGLLRDHRGNAICAFVSKALGDDIFLVELWAVWRGLVLALGLGIKVIWVESDSLSVVKTINKKQPFSPKAASCVNHIWALLKKFEKYKVSHSWRETNRAADHLSKMAILGGDIVFWPSEFPDSLRNIINDDAKGKIYCRR